MDRDHREQRDHDNLNENEEERKVGMDFRNLSRHHGVDHVADVETEVFIVFFFKYHFKYTIKKFQFLITEGYGRGSERSH